MQPAIYTIFKNNITGWFHPCTGSSTHDTSREVILFEINFVLKIIVLHLKNVSSQK